MSFESGQCFTQCYINIEQEDGTSYKEFMS